MIITTYFCIILYNKIIHRKLFLIAVHNCTYTKIIGNFFNSMYEYKIVIRQLLTILMLSI